MPRFIHEKEPFSLKKTLYEILQQPAYQRALAIPKNLEEIGITLPSEIDGLSSIRGDKIIAPLRNISDDKRQLWLGLWWLLDFSSETHLEQHRRDADPAQAIACWEEGAQDGYYCRLALAIESFNHRYATPQKGIELLEKARRYIKDNSVIGQNGIGGREVHRLLGSIYLQGLYGGRADHLRTAEMFLKAYTFSDYGDRPDPMLTGLYEITMAFTEPSQYRLMAMRDVSNNPVVNLLRGYLAYAAIKKRSQDKKLLLEVMPLMTQLEKDLEESFYTDSKADLVAILTIFHEQKHLQAQKRKAELALAEAEENIATVG